MSMRHLLHASLYSTKASRPSASIELLEIISSFFTPNYGLEHAIGTLSNAPRISGCMKGMPSQAERGQQKIEVYVAQTSEDTFKHLLMGSQLIPLFVFLSAPTSHSTLETVDPVVSLA